MAEDHSETPESRAAFWRGRISRWLEARRDRLTPEQIAIVEENIAHVRPEMYRMPPTWDPKKDPVRQDLLSRTVELLGIDRVMQMATRRGDEGPEYRTTAITIANVPNGASAEPTLGIGCSSLRGTTVRVEIRDGDMIGEQTIVLPPVPDLETSPWREFAVGDLISSTEWAKAGPTVSIVVTPSPDDVRIWASVRTKDPATGEMVVLQPD